MKKLLEIESHSDGTSLWRIPCECTDPKHDISLWFEVDDTGLMSLNMEMEIGFYPKSYGWFAGWRRRIGAAFGILFFNHYTMSGDVMLKKEGVAALQEALKRGSENANKATQKTQYGAKQ